MSRVAINTGSVANDGTGDSLRIAGGIINDNFSEIYSQFGDGTNLTPTWDKTAAGINTTSSVGIGTTNPRFTLEVGAVGASGTSLWVNGNARVTGILTVGSSSIVLDGNANKILVGSGISFDGNTGIISATAFYAGGSIISGGGSGGGLNYWGSSASGISTTANVAIGTVTPTSKLTVVGNSLFSGIATFRNNLTLANLTSSSNTLRFGSNSYIDQSNSDVFTFQINSGTNGSGTDSSFVFRTTEPGAFPVPDQAYDALRVYSGGDYWNRLVRVYTNFHADNNAFIGGDLQVGAASTLIGAGSTLGSFKVGTGGTVITTTSAGLVGIGTTNPTSALTVKGNTSLETLNVSGVVTAGYFFGDGSGLTGVVSDVIGIDIRDDDVSVGTAGTINFGSNLTVSSISAGITTVSGGIVGIDTEGTSLFNQLSISGICTFSEKLISLNHLEVGAQLDATTPEFRVWGGNAADDYLQIYAGSNEAYIRNTGTNAQGISINARGEVTLGGGGTGSWSVIANSDGSASLALSALEKLRTIGAGVTVTGTTFTNQLSVSGVSTFRNNVNFLDNDKISLGTGNDFEIYFDGSNCILTNGIFNTGGDFYLNTDQLFIRNYNGTSTAAVFDGDAGVILRYGGQDKFETIGAGITITGTTFTNQLSVSGISTCVSDVNVGVDTSSGVVLTSPNGTKYRLIVANDGTLSTTAV